MLEWNWLCWSRNAAVPDTDRGGFEENCRSFSLPAPIPMWPDGEGFATGIISIGELEVVKITNFRRIWRCGFSGEKIGGATFYRPVGIPDGFFTLGHYAQPNDQPLHGFVLVAKDVSSTQLRPCSDLSEIHHDHREVRLPALCKPLDYILAWSRDDDDDASHACIWFPCAPEGYKSMGYLVTCDSQKPSLDEVQCVRSDLTDNCEIDTLIINAEDMFPKSPLYVWNTRPCRRGMWEKGVSVGTFFCSSYQSSTRIVLEVACLKNINLSLKAMPNMNQIHALIDQYGPTVFFHPEEIYLPSSVPWFFKNGSMLFTKGDVIGVPIDAKGSNLPTGGRNDGKYWIDLPDDDTRSYVMHGNLESAELYVHVKPALGGTFTDIAMWVFCPFNGPATLKIGVLNFSFNKIGEHVADWEHFTLRVSNFTGELWKIYFSQHSGGEWVDACDLEYVKANKAIVYSAKGGHASFPHPGNYLQGSSSLGIGIRNDAARSEFSVDSSIKYQIVAAEYLGDAISEPCWLQYMREWGPTIIYGSKTELEKIISFLPINIRCSVENIFDKLPVEIYKEEGPTGPKEKNMWEGDERS